MPTCPAVKWKRKTHTGENTMKQINTKIHVKLPVRSMVPTLAYSWFCSVSGKANRYIPSRKIQEYLQAIHLFQSQETTTTPMIYHMELDSIHINPYVTRIYIIYETNLIVLPCCTQSYCHQLEHPTTATTIPGPYSHPYAPAHMGHSASTAAATPWFFWKSAELWVVLFPCKIGGVTMKKKGFDMV